MARTVTQSRDVPGSRARSVEQLGIFAEVQLLQAVGKERGMPSNRVIAILAAPPPRNPSSRFDLASNKKKTRNSTAPSADESW
jgi:hypothetical protein